MMKSYTPWHMLCWVAEQTHLISAATHFFGIYHFPSPYGGALEATVIVPVMTFGMRFVIPKGCFALGYVFYRIGDGFVAASKAPSALAIVATRFRVFVGRWISKLGEYFQRNDLEK